MHNELRFATEADLPAIIALTNAAFVVESHFKIGDRTDEAEIQECMAAGRFLLLEIEGELAGSVYARIQGDRGYMGLLSVAPNRQRAGIGTRLILAAEEFCREQGCRWMDISVVNLRTELPPLYERYGYRVTGTAPFPYLDRVNQPCEFILMEKELPRSE